MATKKQRSAPSPRRATLNADPTPSARAEVSRDEMRKLISEAAYFRAKQRGFAPGHELEDWIQAEAEVMRRMEDRPNSA